VLFDAGQDIENDFLWPNRRGYRFERLTYKTASQNVFSLVTTNLQGGNEDLTFKILVSKILKNEARHLNTVDSILIEAASGTAKNQLVQIALQQQNGLVCGKIIELTPEMQQFTIPFSELKPVQQVLLPRAYPPFQAYYIENIEDTNFDVRQIEAIQISIGPGINSEDKNDMQGLLIKKILLK
jgi:hypothetical protein